MKVKILDEFKKFALKGNVLDLAVGVIIGASFGKIVTSLVNDIIMPPIGVILGGIDFSNFSLVLKEATDTTSAVSINYGAFINTIIDFLIVAWVIFAVVKVFDRFKEKESVKPKNTPEEVKLLREIRDALVKDKKKTKNKG